MASSRRVLGCSRKSAKQHQGSDLCTNVNHITAHWTSILLLASLEGYSDKQLSFLKMHAWKSSHKLIIVDGMWLLLFTVTIATQTAARRDV